MEKKSNAKSIALILLGLLTAFGLTVIIISCIYYGSAFIGGGFVYIVIAYAVASLLLLYYALAGYKKPHGNLLRYLFIAFAVCCLVEVVSIKAERTMMDNISNYARGTVVLLAAYVAGRLDHYKSNIVLMSIISALMLISSLATVTYCTTALDILNCFPFFVLWIDLMIAYILRYKEHKEAGLADK